MLKNKVAVITGGSRGIGRAIALKMAENGADIVVIYGGNQQAAQEVCQIVSNYAVKSKSYKCDVSDFAKVKETVAQIITDFGSIDILVNNAGITSDKLVFQMEEADFDRVLDINLKGAFNMIKHTYPYFIRKRAGSIINITSVVGLSGNAGQANYSSAKAGLIGLTKSIAKELGGRNITCNAIAPGFIQTDMTAKLSDKQKNDYIAKIPMKRLGEVTDIANLAVFLASDFSRYITGEVIKVDGGMSM
ncbi:MAG: 3-oxoacyl-[acyl-carrier-protein] reductase [Bacillota bacterium]